MFYPKNDRLENKITIILLILFILIKASPYYYISQYTPPTLQTGINEYPVMRSSIDHVSLLVRVDKSIDDKFSTSLIPGIKFAGIPFEVFFLGLFLITIKPAYNLLSDCLAERPEVCITQCVLRL